MAIALAALAILVPASVTLFGYWFKEQSAERIKLERTQSEELRSLEKDKAEQRNRLEKEQAEQRNRLEKEQENKRLKLETAVHTAGLFDPSGNAMSNRAKCAAGLLALVRVDFAEMAVALLVDLWSKEEGPEGAGANDSVDVSPDIASRLIDSTLTSRNDSVGVSTDIAIQVIDAALISGDEGAQLMAAELLCRHASQLGLCNSLHWPSSINSAWIPELPVTAKLLIIDALVQMALTSEPTQNALRELVLRLYGISANDPERRVKGCLGNLIAAILPAVEALGFHDFMKGPGHDPEDHFVSIDQIKQAAAMKQHHPDGYFEKITENRSERLREWSQKCTLISYVPTALATASCTVRHTPYDYD
jgi:hypothetical protein